MNPTENQSFKVGSFPDQSPTFVIAAGQSQRLEGLATYFYIAEANGPVRIKSEYFAEREYWQGEGKEMPRGSAIKWLQLYNDNAFPLTVKIDLSTARSIDNRLNIVAGRGAALGVYGIETEIEAEATLAGGTLANGGTATFNPTPSSNRLLRKEVVIANNSPTERLKVLDGLNVEISSIPPGQIVTFDHHSTFKIKNESGSGIDVKAFTVWIKNPF